MGNLTIVSGRPPCTLVSLNGLKAERDDCKLKKLESAEIFPYFLTVVYEKYSLLLHALHPEALSKNMYRCKCACDKYRNKYLK